MERGSPPQSFSTRYSRVWSPSAANTGACARDLAVMDGAAIALARDNKLPVIVFSINEPGSLLKVLKGEARATLITGAA